MLIDVQRRDYLPGEVVLVIPENPPLIFEEKALVATLKSYLYRDRIILQQKKGNRYAGFDAFVDPVSKNFSFICLCWGWYSICSQMGYPETKEFLSHFNINY